MAKKLQISEKTKKLLRQAFEEDLQTGDVTTDSIFNQPIKGGAGILAREDGIFCGLPVVKEICKMVQPNLKVKALVEEGSKVKDGDWVLTIQGDVRNILKVERICLNFIQRLSGIAITTKKYVDQIPKQKRDKVKIYDTRKTTPIWRELERYAVRVGGGTNHRFGLFDAILIKNNHVDLAGGMQKTIEQCLKNKPKKNPLIIEARNLEEVKIAITAKPNVILLDNMTIAQIKKAQQITPEKIELEVSGGIKPGRIKQLAQLNIPRISVGALTHSAKAMDYSLRIKSQS